MLMAKTARSLTPGEEFLIIGVPNTRHFVTSKSPHVEIILVREVGQRISLVLDPDTKVWVPGGDNPLSITIGMLKE